MNIKKMMKLADDAKEKFDSLEDKDCPEGHELLGYLRGLLDAVKELR